jgi:predicted flavoprotein YhiN
MVDLRPDLSVDDLADRFLRRRAKESRATLLRRAGLAPVGVGLLREVTANDLPAEPRALASLVKDMPLPLIAPQPLERAISTAGGIQFGEFDEHFMVRRRPGTFVAGEMLDWEAPTGGYLLQATFSTAVAAANGVLAWLAHETT